MANAPMLAPLVKTDAGTLKPTNEQKLPDRKELNKQLAASSDLSESEIRVIITDAFSRKLGALLHPDDIDEDRSLFNLDIDSLVATEKGSWAKKELRVHISHSLNLRWGEHERDCGCCNLAARPRVKEQNRCEQLRLFAGIGTIHYEDYRR